MTITNAIGRLVRMQIFTKSRDYLQRENGNITEYMGSDKIPPQLKLTSSPTKKEMI